LTHPSDGGTGGSGSIAARSTSSRSTGRALVVRTTRVFAVASHPLNWALKSAGEVKSRPGMNEVSKNPLRRSTTPFDSGSRGLSRSSVVANVPVNAATPSACRVPRPMPVSLSQINRRGTRPSSTSSAHIPSSKSWVARVGIIRPTMKREYAAVITRTGSSLAVPSSSGILRGGNHRSHCAASPGSHVSRSAGSTRR
jgi:hypothetical protein